MTFLQRWRCGHCDARAASETRPERCELCGCDILRLDQAVVVDDQPEPPVEPSNDEPLTADLEEHGWIRVRVSAPTVYLTPVQALTAASRLMVSASKRLRGAS